jgi:hypothetical protein
MAEVWLRTNRRALALGMLVPGSLAASGAGGLAWSNLTGQHWMWTAAFLPLAVLPVWMLGELVYAMFQPRLAYADGELLVYLEPTRATCVPIEIVECFFLGQGAGELPKLQGREPETQNVVVRLAESASLWKHRDVRPSIGYWCEGYITLRGAWCEPITPALMKRLNQRLIEVQRERKAAAQEATT